jgi:hypothetical protein
MKLQSVIHHPEKFVSKSFSETLETTNSGLVWMSFRSHYAHNFSNYESILNIEYMPSGEQFSEQRDIWATPYKFNDYEGESFNKAFDEHTARSAELDAETGINY